MKGTIKTLKENGFGFISPAEGGKEIFFHANECANRDFTEMNEGDEVEYEITQSNRGPAATNVTRV